MVDADGVEIDAAGCIAVGMEHHPYMDGAMTCRLESCKPAASTELRYLITLLAVGVDVISVGATRSWVNRGA